MTVSNIITPAVSFFFIAILLLLIRRQRLGIFHTLWWLFSTISMFVLGFFPSVVDKIGIFLGIHYPPVLPIIVAICLLLVKVLTMDIERTRQEIKIRIMAQKMAAYEAELNSLKTALSKENSN